MNLIYFGWLYNDESRDLQKKWPAGWYDRLGNMTGWVVNHVKLFYFILYYYRKKNTTTSQKSHDYFYIVLFIKYISEIDIRYSKIYE